MFQIQRRGNCLKNQGGAGAHGAWSIHQVGDESIAGEVRALNLFAIWCQFCLDKFKEGVSTFFQILIHDRWKRKVASPKLLSTCKLVRTWEDSIKLVFPWWMLILRWAHRSSRKASWTADVPVVTRRAGPSGHARKFS